MTYSEKEVFSIREAIEEKMDHPYLKKFIALPSIDQDKLMLLYTLLKDAGLPFPTMKKYIETTMLVQVALDAHDLVTLTNGEEDEHQLKNRQLTVLAGGYYSGLYYFILSKLEDIQMVRILASAIKAINEEKISIYIENEVSFNTYVERIMKIESLLIQRVADHVKLPNFAILVSHICLLKQLIREKDALFTNESSALSFPFKGFKDKSKREISSLLDAYIMKTQEKIEQVKRTISITNPLLKDCMYQLIHHNDISKEKSVEEG